MWLEGTAHAAIVYRVLGNASKYIDTVQRLENVRLVHPNGDGQGLVAATRDELIDPVFRAVYDARLHVGATAWSLLSQIGANPFEQLPARVVESRIFYNNSAFGGSNAAANAQDDAAIATDKDPLLPGHEASFANYTSYSRGINGIMVDIDGLPGDYTPVPADFEFHVGNDNDPAGWTKLDAEAAVTLREDAGEYGSDRVTIVLPDGAAANTWLQVTVLGGPDTHLGLADDDVFYFGNAIAEAGNSETDAKVTTTDLLLARNNPRAFQTAAVDFPYDYNRDSKVDAIDVLLARNNQTNFLNALSLIDLSGGAQQPQESSLPDLAWLYDYDEATAAQLPAKKDNSAEEAVDLLLGSYVE